MLQHYAEMMRMGYRPDKKTVQQIVASHLEAWEKLEDAR